jgi:Cu-Zn family superoxide dismutase
MKPSVCLLATLLLGAACARETPDAVDDSLEVPRSPLADRPGSSEGEAKTTMSERAATAGAWTDVDKAVARIEPLGGSKVVGTARFEQTAEGVRVVVDIRGLEPNGKHGFHVHEFGDCTAADGESAGGHYSPDGHAHGLPTVATRHAGDMGNVVADADGKVHFEATFDVMSLAGDDPIVGRGLIVHAAEDKGTQPSGGAGARIGCGVIGVSSGKSAT